MVSGFSIGDILSLISWADTFFGCKDIKKLTENYQSNQLIYSLKIPTHAEETWLECDADIQLLENMIMINFIQ